MAVCIFLWLSWRIFYHNKVLEVNRNCQRKWHILAESAICDGYFGHIMQQSRSCRSVPACQPCRLRYLILTRRKNAGGAPLGVTAALAFPLAVMNKDGAFVPLASFCTFKKQPGVRQINRFNRAYCCSLHSIQAQRC